VEGEVEKVDHLKSYMNNYHRTYVMVFQIIHLIIKPPNKFGFKLEHMEIYAVSAVSGHKK